MIYSCTRCLSRQYNQYRLGAGTEPNKGCYHDRGEEGTEGGTRDAVGWPWDANDRKKPAS